MAMRTKTLATCELHVHSYNGLNTYVHDSAGGLKATTKNPNVSDEAKQSAQERLDSMESK